MNRVRPAWARVALVLVGLSAFPAVAIASATPAWAHASLISSSPGADERLAKPPGSVTIQFDEPVSTSAGGVTVLDARGDEVQDGSGRQPTSKTLRVKLRAGLANGTYIANYNGISSDGHIVKGSIVFVVGTGAIADVSGLASHRDAFADDLNRAGQLLAYLGILLAAGLAFFLAFVHDGGPERRRLARLTTVGIALGIVGIAVTIAGEAALASGKGIDSAFDGTTLRSVLRTGLGWQSAAQIAGLALCGISLVVGRQLVRQIVAFYGGLAATAGFVLFGHTRTGDKMWLTIPADIVHVAVAGAWFGGLVGLAVVLHDLRAFDRRAMNAVAAEARGSMVANVAIAAAVEPPVLHDESTGAPASTRTATALLSRPDAGVVSTDGGGERESQSTLSSAVAVVRKFSTVAAVSVGLLGVAGIALGYAEVGAFSRLTSTNYGKLLLIKVAIVTLIGLMAVYNRFFLLRRVTDADFDSDDRGGAGWRELLRTVRFEAVGIVAVLAVTSLLANTAPAASLARPSPPFAATQAFRGGKATLRVTPNQPGTNAFDLTLVGADGRPLDSALGAIVYLQLPAKGLGPLTLATKKTGAGHFVARGSAYLSIVGTWVLTVQLALAGGQQDITFHDGLR